MRFMMMTTVHDGEEVVPPTPEHYAEMGRLIEEMAKAGILLATGGLEARPTHIKSSGGKITITDGPFTEAKEAVVGFALIETKSKEDAIELSKRFWKVNGDGEGDIYQVFGPEDGPPGPAQ